MAKKMFAIVMVALFVAVCFATNGFAANVSANADGNPATVDDTPTPRGGTVPPDRRVYK